MDNIPVTPWPPVKVRKEGNGYSILSWDRIYSLRDSVLYTSVVSHGNEILSAPMRLTGSENGMEIEWREQNAFIMEETAQKVTICASQESAAFIVNTCLETEYDGYCAIDIKIMPRGKTVAEVFGVSQPKSNGYSLDRLWLEIPMKKEFASLYHYYPSSPTPTCADGRSVPFSSVCMSGCIPGSLTMPFKPLLWFGTEEQGLVWCADSDRNWEPAHPDKALELVDSPDVLTLRIHLIDNTVKAWNYTGEEGLPKNYVYPPLSFQMGIQATPVKPFPKNPYKEHICHIDCFKKVEEEYDDYLSRPVMPDSDESGYDRLKRLGVTTLLIHEKWNKIQNYWELSETTRNLVKNIVRECHQRDIKVIPYFGYEVSTLNPRYSEYASSRRLNLNHIYAGGWYRKPGQRAYTVCFHSTYAKDMAEGIKRLVEEYGFDGVYLDSTLQPDACINGEHGCGFYDVDGQMHPSYPITVLREFTRNLYEFFEARGGIVNTHLSNCCNIPALSFAHLNWDGEHSQTYINAEGLESVPMDYMRAEYSARNFGIPYELLAYTFENWSFQDSLSIGMVHGILSRPNDMGYPLELMSLIWKTVDRYDFEQAEWKPYWNNHVFPPESRVRLSYYETGEEGRKRYLVFIANPTDDAITDITLKLSDYPVLIFSALQQRNVEAVLRFGPRESDVLLVEETGQQG